MRYAADMRDNLFLVIRRTLRAAPVTAVMVVLAAGLFVAGKVYESAVPEDATEAPRRLGAVTQLVIYETRPGDEGPTALTELAGLYDLWDGEWWRIGVSGFHHGGLVHLLLNAVALLYLGRLLEPRMHRAGYLLFFLSATVLSLVPEFLAGHGAVGLSGGAYAVFGCLLVLRVQDDGLIDALPAGAVAFGLLWLPIGAVLTALDAVPIANLAHAAGLAYGWLTGQIVYGRWNGWMPRIGCGLAHLLVVPAVALAVSPFWNARWQWYQAWQATDPDRKIVHLEAATRRAPELARPWHDLAELHWRRNGPLDAWRTALRGLDYNRTDARGLELARWMWRNLDPQQKPEALQTLRTVFEEEEHVWLQKLVPWRELARILLRRDQPLLAWQTVMEAFAAEETDALD
ncbi:MAG: rhomboid family intramembrane serine protease, partial [Planctomycetaceae bacterium]